MRALFATFALCVLLGGCVLLDPSETAEPETALTQPAPEQTMRPGEPRRVVVSDAEHLIAYYAQLKRISGPELAREHEAARQAYGSARSDYNRVRLGMIMTLPGTPYYDEPRALEVLEPLARNASAPLSGLALLLTSQIQERKRLDATAHALQQKLDALKSLERSLNERKR